MTEVLDDLDAPPIDPRFARRRVEVARQQGRRRLRLLVIPAAVLICSALAVGLLYSPVMDVRHIRVVPQGILSQAQVEADTGLTAHELMIKVDTGAIRRRLDAVARLGGAQVVRRWPTTVSVTVRVRTAIAAVSIPGTGRWALVDPTGRVLSDGATKPFGIPQIVGVTPPAPGGWLAGSLGPGVLPGLAPTAEVQMAAASDSALVPRSMTAVLAAIQALPSYIRAEILTATWTTASGLTMSVQPADMAVGSIEVDFGDGSQLAAKLTSMITMITQADLSGVSKIDVSVPDRPAALTAR